MLSAGGAALWYCRKSSIRQKTAPEKTVKNSPTVKGEPLKVEPVDFKDTTIKAFAQDTEIGNKDTVRILVMPY